jgi:hypothetical protein
MAALELDRSNNLAQVVADRAAGREIDGGGRTVRGLSAAQPKTPGSAPVYMVVPAPEPM